jgi:hypothetical protein
MTTGLMLIVVIVLLALFAIMFVVGIYNALVTLRNRYKNAYSQIDVQLKRRYDLIPNLVETAKGYLAHERGTLEAVITARNAAVTANTRAAQNPGDASAMKELSGAETAYRSIGPFVCSVGGLSRPQGKHDHVELDGRTDFHGKQSLIRAPGVQRLGYDVQHTTRNVSIQHHRGHVQLWPGGIVRHR